MGQDEAVRAGMALLVHDLQRVLREAMKRDGVDVARLAWALETDVQAVERVLTEGDTDIETLVRVATAIGVRLGGRQASPEVPRS